ncbi:MAG: hypothetical protein IK070_03360 [Clostridia bacterium]|nr:hypothetical protein [Clostridia bacterium]
MSKNMDEALNPSDYTPEELAKLLGKDKVLSKTEKEKYFEYYDDVKDRTLPKQDW